MKKILLALLICASTTTFAQKTNFSGAYKLDTVKTKFGAAPKAVLPASIDINQDKDKLTLTETNFSGPANTKEIKFDGTVFTKELPGGKKATYQMRWSEDKTTFSLERKALNAEGQTEYGMKETWSSLDGGKTILLDRDVEQSNGMKYNIKGYFNKQ